MPTPEASGQVPPPSALSLLVCDNLWEDQLSGKTYILGTYSEIRANTFPAVHPQMAVHVSLTNGRGQNDIRIRLIDTDEERAAIWQQNVQLDFPDPRAIFEIGFVLGEVTFPEEGEYRVQVHRGNDLVIERRIVVIPPEAESESSSED
jgi:hypothetical protein